MDNNNLMGSNSQPAGFPPAVPNRPTPPMPQVPPPPEITLRTMQSDADAIKQTGGSIPSPKPFTPPELIRDFSRPASPPPAPPIPSKIMPSEFSAPRPSAPLSGPAKPVIEEEIKPGFDWKKMLLWGGSLLVIIGAGLAGYFYVYPKLFPAISAPPAPLVTPPATETPAPIENPIPEVIAPPVLQPHQTLLSESGSVSSVQLSSTDLTSLKTALQQEAQKTMPAGSLAEINLSDANGQIPASLVISSLLAELSADTVKNLFQDDFTTALFYDANGVWPVYILKLNANSSPVDAQSAISGIESSADLANLFIADPGTPNIAGFKSGQANGTATRYLPFSKTGASLNIAWANDKLIISASYNGLKKVLGSLAQ